MILLAVLMAVVLGAIALLHVAWGLGLMWPGRDQQNLIDTVIGHPEATRMPGLVLCLVVAAAIGAAGFWALWGVGWRGLEDVSIRGVSVRRTGLCVLVAVFCGRGALTYLPSPLSRAVEPFRALDRRVYAPLCLLLGLGFLSILMWG